MHKFFYGVGIFLFLILFCTGCYSIYEISILKAQILEMGEQTQEEFSIRTEGKTQETGYLLRAQQGVVVVYKKGDSQIYERTTIPVRSLPSSVQMEIEQGKYLKSELELYGFLENYSS